MEESVTRPEAWSRRLASGWLFWPLAAAALGLVALAVLGPELAHRADVQRQVALLRAEVEALQETRLGLEAVRDALQSDPAFTEQVLRHELGLVRPGEIPLPQPGDLAPPPAPAPPPAVGAALPPAVLEAVADPSARLAAILTGGALLGAAILLSAPSRARPAPA